MRNWIPRFLEKFDPVNDGCWVWQSCLDRLGYGQFSLGGRARSAYAVGYRLFRGDVPFGLELDHLCRNPACVNPWHLEAVTHQENIRRGIGVGNPVNRSKTHCAHGHEYTESNTYWRPDGHRDCRMCRMERKLRA